MADIPVTTLQEASREAEAPTERFTDPISAVSDLLSPAAVAEQPGETPAQAESPPDESWDLKALAEKLGAEPEKLYDVKIPMTDGSEMTLSALKDAYRPVAELEKARSQLVEEMTSSKTEVVQTRQEMGALLGLLSPDAITPELVREATRLAEQERSRNVEQVLKLLPEWKDPIRKAADFADIRRVAREAGYTDAEVKAAELGYADPRMLKLLLRAVRPAEPEKPKPAAKVAAKPTPAQQFGRTKAAVTMGRTSPYTAVENLLKGL
jgi:hypothetical protein